MLVCVKPPNWVLGLCLLFWTQVVAADFSIHFAEVRLVDEVYLLDAKLRYTLSETALEALHNGIALTLELTLMIERERWYLWDKTVAKLKQGYQLKYQALSGQYRVKYLNTGIEENFPSLEAAFTKLGHLRDFPLIDKHLIEPEGNYWLYLQIHLDIESLPVPLRPLAYLSSKWRLSSDWYLCPLPLPQ